jgi:hypothetical protein
MAELKAFILEPLEITEDNFEAAYKNALREFSKTHVMTDILRVGVMKEIFNKIVVKK